RSTRRRSPTWRGRFPWVAWARPTRSRGWWRSSRRPGAPTSPARCSTSTAGAAPALADRSDQPMAYEGDVPWLFRALDYEALAREFPPPPNYFREVFRVSRDELRARQEQRFLQTVARGWEIPFFRRHWGTVGLQPSDIRGLDDLTKLPP